MTTWRVRVELAPPAGAPPDSVLTQIRRQLQGHDPQVVVEYDGHLTIAVTVEASSRRAAFDRGDKTVAGALDAVGLADLEVVAVGVLTAAEEDRRQRQPRVPRLAGVSEAAAILGVSNSRAKVIAVQHSEHLPLVTQFAGEKGAKVWLAESWERFNDTWDRRRTGRPPGSGRKATAPE
ncbi:hypothetical protein [Krasilnikovia sp. MM14-A1259]|uniref:hypothetical protein n=1 Tax=Krasilnikovia sp. MM14-A1259 TaxID=3373539 RepID=UPI0037FB9433